MNKKLARLLHKATDGLHTVLAPFVSEKRLKSWKPIHLCWWYDELGEPTPDYFIGTHINTPTVSTDASPSSITSSSATYDTNNISDTGGENCTERGICYVSGSGGTPTTADTTVSQTGSFGTGNFSATMTGLSPGTTYSVRAYAINSAGTGYGSTVEVTTVANTAPSVSLNSPTDASSDSDTTPTLSFTGTDSESDDIRYNVQVGDSLVVGEGSQIDTLATPTQDVLLQIYSGFNKEAGQSFIGDGSNLGPLDVYLRKVGTPTGNITAYIYAHSGTYGSSSLPTGSALATSNTVDISTLSTSFGLIRFDWAEAESITLTSSTNYVFAVAYSGGDSSNRLEVGCDSGNGHGGNAFTKGDDDSLVAYGGSPAHRDVCFTVYAASGTSFGNTLLDKTSGTDSGFSGSPDNTDPFTSGQQVSYTVQAGDALSADTYYWRVRGIDPSGSNTYGSWSSTRSFTVTGASTQTINPTLVSSSPTVPAPTVTTTLQTISPSVVTSTPTLYAPTLSNAGWYNGSWNYRVKITVASSQVASTLTDFPVYVDLNDLPAGFHTNVNQTDARDIRVTTDDGSTEVPREVVFYDSSTDAGELHFKAPTLSSSVDTDFYIYYGNASATEPATTATYGSENVWTSSYQAVYHLGEAVNTTTNGYVDSTSNSYDGTGTSMALTEQAGKLSSDSQDFDGSADYIQAGDVMDLGTNDLTLSHWIKTSQTPASYAFSISKSIAAASDYRYAAGIYGSTGKPRLFMKGNGGTDTDFSGGTTVNNNAWHLIHYVFDRSGNATIYVNGNSDGSASISTWDGQDFQSTNPFRIGSYTASDNTSISLPYDGLIDEVRVAFTVRSADWISAEHTNQNTTTTFYTAGSQEEQSGAETISPSLVTSSPTVLAPTLTTLATISPSLVTSSSTVPAPTLTGIISPDFITGTTTVYSPTLDTLVTITVDLLSRTATVEAPTITTGAVDISPNLVTSTSSVFAPTLDSAITISPNIVTSSPQVYAPTFTTEVTTSPDFVTQNAQVYAPTLGAEQTITPDLTSSASAVYAPTVNEGAVTISPAVVDSTPQVFAPTLLSIFTTTPSAVDSTPTVQAPTISTITTISPSLVNRTSEVYEPSVGGGVTIAPSSVTSTPTVQDPTISTEVTISPALVNQTPTIPAPTITTGAVTISADKVVSSSSVFNPTLEDIISPSLVTSTPSVNQPSLNLEITAGFTTSSPTVQDPTLTFDLSPALVQSISEVFAPTVEAGNATQTISPAFISPTGETLPTIMFDVDGNAYYRLRSNKLIKL